MALEDIIKSIGDEAERGQFAALLEKYSPVKQMLELGEQVKPAFEKLTTLGLPAAAELARVSDWVEYREKHWLKDQNTWDTTAAAKAEAETLKARVTELEGMTGGEVNIEQMKAEMEKMGFVKKDELVKDFKLIDKEALTGTMHLQAKRFEEVNAAIEEKSFEHYEKFKAPLPRKEVYEYMGKTGERDVLKAYAEVIKPMEHKLEVDRLKAEVTAAEARGVQKGIEDAQARVNAQRMPVDGGGSQKRPHFMQRIFAKRTEAQATSNGRLGTGSAAQAGFQEYQKAKMGGASV